MQLECFKWPPPKNPKPIELAIAASVLSVESTLELKTIKTGYIARAASIFKINKIYVYKDKNAKRKDFILFKLLLKYVSTPPHLRKKIFKLTPELKMVGLMPPLRLPVYDLPVKPTKGLIMHGLVEECDSERCKIYLGRYGFGLLYERLKPGSIVLVKIIRVNPLIVEKIDNVKFYTGFDTASYYSLRTILKRAKQNNYYIIGTSKRGKCFNTKEFIKNLENRDGILIVIGGPAGNVIEDAGGKEYFDSIINTIPFQGSKTVRSEEAILISLGVIANSFLSRDFITCKNDTDPGGVQ